MQIKIFSIRLDANFTEIDQNSLNDFLESIDFKKSSVQYVESEDAFWSVVVHFEEKNSEAAKDKKFEGSRENSLFKNNDKKENLKTVSDLNAAEEQIYADLKTWRNQKANEIGLAPFIICHNAHLMEIAVSKPNCINDLKQIKGFGENKANQYGEAILSLLSAV